MTGGSDIPIVPVSDRLDATSYDFLVNGLRHYISVDPDTDRLDAASAVFLMDGT